MALNNQTPMDTLNTVQVLLEILQAVDSMKDIKKLVKEAYSLTEQEEKRLAKARDDISHYEALKAQNAKAEETLAKARNEINNKIAYNQELLNKITDKNEALDKRIAAMDERQSTLNLQSDDLEKRENALSKGMETLSRENEKLARAKAAVADEQAALKEKKQQLDKLLGN